MTYQLVLSGHGMEIVTGSISKETYNYFKSNQISIEDFVSGSVTVPQHLMPLKENAWFECDDVAHLHNVEFQEKNKLIISKNEKVIHELNLDTNTLEKLDIEVDYDEIYIAEAASDTYRFMGKSYEKGTFFSTHIDEKTFDIKQIKIMNHWSRTNLLNTFNPQDQSWHQQLITRGNKVFKAAQDYLKEL